MEAGIMLYIDCKVDVYEQIKTLKEIGVKKTFINCKHPEIDKVLDFIKSEGLVCDNLHSEYIGKRPMPLFGKKLAALHIHDNFLTHDKHLIPFTGKIDFDYVGKELAECGFGGTVMLEIMYGGNEENSIEPTYKDYALKAKHAAEKLIEIIEKYRNE